MVISALLKSARFRQIIRICFKRRYTRTTVEVAFDTTVWLCALVAEWATRDGVGATFTPRVLVRTAPVVLVLQVSVGLVAGLYRHRHMRGSSAEAVAVLATASGVALTLAALGAPWLAGQPAQPGTVLGAGAFALLAMVSARHLWVTAVTAWQRSGVHSADPVKIIVFGAGSAGNHFIQQLLSQDGAGYQPVALLDDDPSTHSLRIRGVRVRGGRQRLARVAAETGATVLVIAIARPDRALIGELTAAAETCGLAPTVLPHVGEMLGISGRIEGVRDRRLGDLLGRRPVRIDTAAVAEQLRGKRILVTGAGGSIGSELCHQLHRFDPATLIMLDRDESALHAVQLSLLGRALLDSDDLVLADIRDPHRVHEVFERFRPQIIFHAAALKHLPLLERYPAEALKSNVWGTQTVLEAAAACGVEVFVNISTDKAANPASVLGYSKRIAERLTAQMGREASGTYLSVRFGNVLGSRGSVLTALSAQVAAGGPVTVTHPDVTRYFMTAAEAVQLVLQATVCGRDGEVLVLDMGAPVRIADIARRLAAASPHPVEIVFTGLRPGEKLTEDLLSDGEIGERPMHPLITHVPVAPLLPELVRAVDPGTGSAGVRALMAQRAAETAPADLVRSGGPDCLSMSRRSRRPAPGMLRSVRPIGPSACSTCWSWGSSCCRPPCSARSRPSRSCSMTGARCSSGRNALVFSAAHSYCSSSAPCAWAIRTAARSPTRPASRRLAGCYGGSRSMRSLS